MIAGEECEIQFSVNLGVSEWSLIVATGRMPINMRDYNVDPPMGLLGIIKKDDEMYLAFKLYF